MAEQNFDNFRIYFSLFLTIEGAISKTPLMIKDQYCKKGSVFWLEIIQFDNPWIKSWNFTMKNKHTKSIDLKKLYKCYIIK